MRRRLTDAGQAGYEQILDRLRAAYDDGAAARRDATDKPGWRLDERAAFLDRLRAAQARTLLEVGAGTGQDSAYFQAEGLTVTAVDIAPEMVARIRAKEVPAYVRDVLNLGFPERSFDAAYSVNTFLHVPNTHLPAALRAVRDVLRPGGLFFLGGYGGDAEEGVATDDRHEPGRFFSFRTDEQLLRHAAAEFEILDFHLYEGAEVRFQALTLVRP